MGRILFDEISDLELAKSRARDKIKTIIQRRWGGHNIPYASFHDDYRNCVIVWYHSKRHGEAVAGWRTAMDLEYYGLPLPSKVLT